MFISDPDNATNPLGKTAHYQPGTKDPRPVVDLRDSANFVHVQLAGANNFDKVKMNRVVNKPVNEWAI